MTQQRRTVHQNHRASVVPSRRVTQHDPDFAGDVWASSKRPVGMKPADASTLEDWTVAFNIRAMIPAKTRLKMTRHFFPLQEGFEDGTWRIRCTSRAAIFCRRILQLLALCTAFLTPGILAMQPICPSPNSQDLQDLTALHATQFTVDILYIVLSTVVFFTFSVVTKDKFELVAFRSVMTWQLRHPGLWLDLAALVGDVMQLVYYAEAGFGQLWFGENLLSEQWLSLLDLLRLWRLWEPSAPIIVSVQFEIEFAIILLQLFLAAHLFSCYWMLLGHYEQQIWGYEPWTELVCSEQFWAAFYFSTYTLTSIGYGDFGGTNSVERFSCAIYMMVGQMLVAKIFAELTWLTSLRNISTSQRLSERKHTQNNLIQAAIHPDLVQRVLCYQDFHDHFIQHDFEQSGNLSAALLEELRLARYHELLIRARYFRQQPVEVISQLVKHFQEHVDLPGDFIIRNGEVDHHIFFMRSGKAGVYVTTEPPLWESEAVRYFRGGDSFGEVSVLASTPRTAWIMARTYCMTTKVHSSSIMSVLQSHPGSFLLLVKNLLEYQDVEVDWKLSWEDLKVKLRKLFDTSEDAFNQFSMGTALITHASFEAAMEPLGLEAGLELQIRWAELDLDCNGDVSYEEFSTLVGTWGTSTGAKTSPDASLCRSGTLDVDQVISNASRTRSPKVLQPVNPHRDVLRRRLAHGDAVSEVGAMLEKRIAESHASLERKFEHLAKQLLQPGATALPGVSPPERCNLCCAGGSASRQASSRKRESQLS